MAVCSFSHVKICGVKTVVPEHFIDIDDEIQYYDNNPKKLARQKKMNGYGRRYIADEKTTVVDLACFAAEKLMAEMGIAKNDIDLLIFVNQKPDYPEPCDACVAHGRLGIDRSCTSIDINLGCSGYVHALMTAFSLMSVGAYKRGLILAGDVPAKVTDQTNRKAAPVFGDAASATILEYDDQARKAHFVTGTDGSGWDRIARPFGGMALPIEEDVLNKTVENAMGDKCLLTDSHMKGEDVFRFTMDVVPQMLQDIVASAGWSFDEVDFFALHQANKQIVEMIADKVGIPPEKAPVTTFTNYANNSTNSVVTVVCDQLKDRKCNKVVLGTFGIGLSWGAAAVDLSKMHNGGINLYKTPVDALSRSDRIAQWVRYIQE